MLISKGLLVVAALAPVTSAFFLFFPPYRCIQDHTCIVSDKRATDDHAVAVATFPIILNTPNDDVPHEIRVRRLANRLKKKYENRATKVRAKVLEERDGIVKRTNTYSIVTAATPTQTNSAGIDQDGTDFSYFVQAFLGSNKTARHLLLDTGTSTTWVMGTSCKSSPCLDHNTFGPADSTTFVSSSIPFDITYGSGAVSGVYGKDSISLAGIEFDISLGIANVTSDDFNSFPVDGLLGLAQTSVADEQNFIQALVASKSLKSNLFGVTINRESDGLPDTGEISFGAPDTSKFVGSLTYNSMPTSAQGDWAITMENIGFGGVLTGLTNRLTYIDTGTTYIFGPQTDVATFHQLVPGSKSTDGVTYGVPCSTTTPAQFIFSGVAYNVSYKDWVGPPGGISGLCTSNIYGTPVVPGAWLLGDTFLKNVYTVFNIDENSIGFADKILTSTSSVTTVAVSTLTNTVSNTGTTTTSSSSSTTLAPGFDGHGTSASSISNAKTPSSTPSVTPFSEKSPATLLEVSQPAMIGIIFAITSVFF